MTIEEAKEYFGEKFIEPRLKAFNEERNPLCPDRNRKSKAKKGVRYWYFYTKYEKEFIEQFGKQSGWVLGTCVFRRHGIAFFKFEGSKDKNFQYEFYDGGNAQDLIPEVISLKDFGLKPEYKFAYSDMNGMVKFID